jgi:hypothetical protein
MTMALLRRINRQELTKEVYSDSGVDDTILYVLSRLWKAVCGHHLA